jgi:hypothetical protein
MEELELETSALDALASAAELAFVTILDEAFDEALDPTTELPLLLVFFIAEEPPPQDTSAKIKLKIHKLRNIIKTF